MSMRRRSVQRSAYRLLLHLYPGSFRRQYGGLMTQAFSDRLAERGGLRTWFSIAGDLSLSVPQQLLEVTVLSQKWMAALTALAAATMVVAAAIGAGPPIVLIGAVVGFITFLGLWSVKKSGRPADLLYGDSAPKLWKWWTVLAVLLAISYVIAAAAQVINDPKMTNFGALGIMSGFAALIAVGLKLRSHSRIAGDWMIVFATVPGLMFFWVVVPAVVGLAIVIGAVMEISRAVKAPAAT